MLPCLYFIFRLPTTTGSGQKHHCVDCTTLRPRSTQKHAVLHKHATPDELQSGRNYAALRMSSPLAVLPCPLGNRDPEGKPRSQQTIRGKLSRGSFLGCQIPQGCSDRSFYMDCLVKESKMCMSLHSLLFFLYFLSFLSNPSHT